MIDKRVTAFLTTTVPDGLGLQVLRDNLVKVWNPAVFEVKAGLYVLKH